MVIVSTLVNSGICPYWKVEVTVVGKYKQNEDGSWSFMNARCPIIENSKLPRYEQEPEFRMMTCRNSSQCPLYTEFQPRVTEII